MQKTYSLDYVSKFLNIPKSTLRYWESVGLIQSSRNDENEYREYTTEEVILISDIHFYRSLGFSINDLKYIYTKTITEHTEILQNSRKKIHDQIQDLRKTLNRIDERITFVDMFYQAKKGEYYVKEPDFNYVIHLHPVESDYAHLYTDNQNLLCFAINDSNLPLTDMGISSMERDEFPHGEIIWTKDLNKNYTPCLVRVDQFKLDQDMLKEAIQALKDKGETITNYIGQYLVTDIYDDYYMVWIESKK